MSDFYVVRAGRYGERIDWCFEGGLAGGGWTEVPDLTSVKDDREALKSVIEKVYGGPKGRVSAYTGQLWMFINRISVGDYVVLPLRATSQIAIGMVTRSYIYDTKEPDQTRKHKLGVDWLRTDISKTLIKQDLLYQLGGASTIFAVGNNDANYRLQQLLAGKPDPGARSGIQPQTPKSSIDFPLEAEQELINLEEVAQDEIAKRLQEDFKGHELSELIEALLTAEGYVCRNSPPGADGGVDILAGRGPLGMDSPKLVVQVKSQNSAVSDVAVQQLHGALDRFRADQALLVTFGGVTGPAKAFLDTQYFKVRVWTLDDILAAVYKHYDSLSSEMKARLPLKRIWIPLDIES